MEIFIILGDFGRRKTKPIYPLGNKANFSWLNKWLYN